MLLILGSLGIEVLTIGTIQEQRTRVMRLEANSKSAGTSASARLQTAWLELKEGRTVTRLAAHSVPREARFPEGDPANLDPRYGPFEPASLSTAPYQNAQSSRGVPSTIHS